MSCNQQRETCDVCGKEYEESEDIFECDEGLCPFAVGSIDPYSPLNFSKDYNSSTYVPEYVPDPDDQEDTLI